MSIYQAIVLGVVQGLGEFLPVSSSAHLILVPWLFGWDDPGLAFDVALHWGTLVAVLAVFWRDWIALIHDGLLGGPRRRLFWALVISAIPGAILGALLNKKAEENLRSPMMIAATMAIMGVVLWLADRVGKKQLTEDQMSYGKAAAIGFAQAAALIPGVSRSGGTITLGLFFGFRRGEIAKFSFLMSTPIIFGAGVVKLPKMLHEMHSGQSHVSVAALLAGLIAAAVVGTLVIRWLLEYLLTRSYAVFAIYRMAVAVAIVALWFTGKK